MFKYICMPKLVAHYLREFSVQSDGTPSLMYKFVFSLCLPFVSQTFRVARLRALAIAECTNSLDQISRVLAAVTGATVSILPFDTNYYLAYDGADAKPNFPYDDSEGNSRPEVPYSDVPNKGELHITLNEASKSEVEAYLPLLIPFYVEYNIIYVN